MEIRQLEVDFDKHVLRINGKDFVEIPIVVTLPGPDNWQRSVLFNKESGTPEEHAMLHIVFHPVNSKP